MPLPTSSRRAVSSGLGLKGTEGPPQEAARARTTRTPFSPRWTTGSRRNPSTIQMALQGLPYSSGGA
ncbi:uncharacterized protein BCR38DRAFT_437793 [Pseudomassariella vexata]|uniref:Uncharacterized protein n=1 Tax=Pseudomassariella vexata TaxID=1141098 RepID=A0A1Y2DU83_9PEZI|nr:uncharacterized protein BCR38DRAFT_437793 [Pseudomassariella vexata]ORY62195.1 hypothetical protein BCR38DRAFT_437793 [Pseudomassariella vexata]